MGWWSRSFDREEDPRLLEMTDFKVQAITLRKRELVERLKTCGEGEYKDCLVGELKSVIISEILLGMVQPAVSEEGDQYGVVLVDQENKQVFHLPATSMIGALTIASDIRVWMRGWMNKVVEEVGKYGGEISTESGSKENV